MSRERLEAMKSNEMHRLQIIHVHYQQSQTQNFHLFFSKKMKSYEMHRLKIIRVLYQRSQTTTFTFSPKLKSNKVDRLEITHVHYQQGHTETFTFCKDRILTSKNKCIASEVAKNNLEKKKKLTLVCCQQRWH